MTCDKEPPMERIQSMPILGATVRTGECTALAQMVGYEEGEPDQGFRTYRLTGTTSFMCSCGVMLRGATEEIRPIVDAHYARVRENYLAEQAKQEASV